MNMNNMQNIENIEPIENEVKYELECLDNSKDTDKPILLSIPATN